MENSNFKLSHASTEAKPNEADFQQIRKKAAAGVAENEKPRHNAGQHPLPPPPEEEGKRRKDRSKLTNASWTRAFEIPNSDMGLSDHKS